MKCVSLLVLSAAAAGVWAADDFNTGQAARLIIGQPQFTRQDFGASETLIGGVSGVAYANNTLFIADSNRIGASPSNNRVLIYNNISGQLPAATDELAYVDPPPTCPACKKDEGRRPVALGQATVVLGQPDFTTTDPALKPTQSGLRNPTAVASDGIHLVVADTDSNRVLIWNSIPTRNNQPADVVVGQPNFTSNTPLNPPTASSMSGPQGVWIGQDGKLFVADTHNNRVLIFNRIPTSNGAAANVVLGQPNFNVGIEKNIAQVTPDPKPTTMSDPVSVTSDPAGRLYVADLGYNRVLIWNTTPTANQAPADIALGQPDETSAIANNSSKACQPLNPEEKDNLKYPPKCNATLSFPRFALSDGRRLFVADGGNDRVLIWSTVPTHDGQPADFILGQIGGDINQASDAADSQRTPIALAWDGANLYVADSYNRRVNVYTPADQNIPYTAVRNAASREIFAVGSITFSGTIKENDSITIKIQDAPYTYKMVKDDTVVSVIRKIVALINDANDRKGDPNVLALSNPDTNGIILTARISGTDGNNIAISVTPSANAVITASTSGATLSGGGDAAKIGPGTVVIVKGERLSDNTAAAEPNADPLPTELAGTQVYFDGVRAPLMFVSPTQITAQVPVEFLDTTSINAFVRTKHANGTVSVSTPVAVTIVLQNPGIFADEGTDPRAGVVLHGSSSATGTVSVDGTAKAGDVAAVTIEDRVYSYTVKADDKLESIRDGLIELINADPKVTAFPAGVFTRIRLKARVEGPDGNGIPYTASAPEGANVIMTATTPALCCANVAGARVTDSNPALPGETIIVYATGLGKALPDRDPDTEEKIQKTGEKFRGGVSSPTEFVSSLAGGKTANVLYAGLAKGMVGVWEVDLELNSDIPSNPVTQLTIAQDVFVSNIVTVPVFNPNPSSQ